MRPTVVFWLVSSLVGLSLVFGAVGVWQSECSNYVPGAIDIVCVSYNPYHWLLFPGLGIIAFGSLTAVWVQTRPEVRLANYWRTKMTPRSRLALIIAGLSLGWVMALVNWSEPYISADTWFYPEYFWPRFFLGSFAGILVSLVVHRAYWEAGRHP